jgi:hypothetical protein
MTDYIGPIAGELEDGRAANFEVRVDDGEDGVAHQLSVVDHEEGDEYVVLYFTDDKLAALRDAIDKRLAGTIRT